MSNFTRNYTTGAATAGYRIAKFGSADGAVIQGAASSDALIGVFDELDHASGERADVIRDGYALIEYGGTVTRGNWLTADADGKAVDVGTVTAGTNASVIGRAEVSGVAGDIVSIVLAVGQIQG